MNINATRRATLVAACLISVGCHNKIVEAPPSFRIVATDTGFEAPESVAAELRHIIFENRGSEIHESMLVKLPKGMLRDDELKDFAGAQPVPAVHSPKRWKR